MMDRIIILLLAANLLSFALFGLDKWKAIHGYWRISEKTLLLSALPAAFPGALTGMYFSTIKQGTGNSSTECRP